MLLPMCVLFVSCGGDEDKDLEGMKNISIVSGDHQTERVGAVLPSPMVVKVTDLSGQPAYAEPVFFSTMDSGAAVDPATAYTDRNGFATARMRLGSVSGNQKVGARAGSDSTTFNHTAVQLGCSEENPESACQWPAGHVFITTTSSSMLSIVGTVLIDFDPQTGATEKVLETDLILRDIDFSSRGEMFVTTNEKVYKVNPSSKAMEEYTDLPVLTGSEIEFNMGGVLLLVGNTNVYTIGCPGTDASLLAEYYVVAYENLAVDPVSRGFYIATKSGTTYNIIYNQWDGRGPVSGTIRIDLDTGIGYPKGMCVDMAGFLYVTIDSNGNSRSVARIRPGLENDPKWFDFCAYFAGNNPESGRWGDITVLGDYLYLIDTRMNRLVVLNAAGTTDEEKFVEEFPSEVFSKKLSDSERYGIAAVPEWLSCAEPH